MSILRLPLPPAAHRLAKEPTVSPPHGVMDEENAECTQRDPTMRSATVSRVLVGHVNADVNVPTTQVRVVSRPITPRHVVRCRVFDATSFTSRQHRSRWFEPTAALRDGVETGQSGGLGVSLRAPGGHSCVTHSRNPADTGGHERTWRGRRLSTGGHWRSRWDTGGHDVGPVRDREAPGSNPGPPTSF